MLFKEEERNSSRKDRRVPQRLSYLERKLSFELQEKE